MATTVKRLAEQNTVSSELEDYVVRAAAYWTLRAVEKFYENPENMKAYQKWKKQRDAEKRKKVKT